MESEVTRLVNTYKRTQDPKLLEEIYKKMEPLIMSTTYKFAPGGIDKNILKEQIKIYIKQAIDNYTPGKGSFEAFANSYVQQAYRYVNNYQHPLRLPENYKLEYDKYDTIINELKAKLHRMPTAQEISKASGIPIDQVKTYMQRQINPLEESWVGKSFSDTLALKEALIMVKTRYGNDIANIVEKVLKGEKMTNALKGTGLNYNQVYRTVQKAIDDVDNYLANRVGF